MMTVLRHSWLRSTGILGGKYIGEDIWKGKSFLNLLIVLQVQGYVWRGAVGEVRKITWVQIL